MADPAQTGLPQIFATLCKLEQAAIKDGYSLKQRITAFRKLYYDSSKPTKTYAGAVIAGGAWNLLIPGAANTKAPPSWQKLGTDVVQIKANQVVTIGGAKVDIGHLFAGLDAANHPTSVTLGGIVKMRSNQEAATFVGDLGSVVVEYLYGQGKTSFYDVARKRSKKLEEFYDGKQGRISKEDMAGNADSYLVTFKAGETLCDALKRYYGSAYKTRYAGFADKIGLKDAATKKRLHEEVFNAALAYAAATGRRGDVLLVLKDPGPGLLAPTFWEAYWNISGWVVYIFAQRIQSGN